MLKVGLIGVGGISGAHIPSWRRIPEAKLVALCDIRPEQMDKWKDIGANLYTDVDDMLNNEELDILDICLPTYLHADFAVKAMERGINVICEKPISLNKEDVARVYGTARAHNVRFMVAQVLRFWDEYVFIKDAYDTKKYGKLLSANMYRLGIIPRWSFQGWMQDEKRSGLVPFDLHIHDLDYMVYAFGKPTKMDAFRSKRPDQDYIHAVYTYPDFVVTADASWYAGCMPFHAGFRFQFEQAVIEMDGGKFMLYPVEGDPVDLYKNAGTSDADGAEIGLPRTDAYYNEIRYFADCVLAGREPDRVKPEELETVLTLIKNF